MKKPAILSCVFITFVILIIYPVIASGWSCGREIVWVGDSKSKVLSRCGRPDSSSVTSQKESGSVGGKIRSSGRFRGGYSSTTVTTEVWTYDCGRNDYLYELTFEGDTLKKIESVGSGTSYDGCRSAEERRILGED
jgi:hypothetical protein